MTQKLTLALLFISLFLSCGKKSDQVTLVSSTGRINHILIVMNDEDWDGRVGDEIKQIIGEPVKGLPQEEDQFSVNQVDPLTFNSLFKRHRNILFVGLDTIRNFYTNHNIFASPQTTLTVLGEDKDDLIANIREHSKEIVSIFKDNDLKLYQNKLGKETHDAEQIETLQNLGLNMEIPRAYRMVDDTGSFMWYRHTQDRALLNIIAYEIPLNGREVGDIDLIAERDSIGKHFIPGQFDNTYLKTEHNFTPVNTKQSFSNITALESRGLWLVEGDWMGGPYLSYTIHDPAWDRFIVIEGFSYSPATKKRDFVFELEAILKTTSRIE